MAADPRYLGVDLHAHALALSISVSPLPCLPFSPLKRRCAAVMIIIEIQDSFVFGCSHFIKVALIRNKVRSLPLECSPLQGYTCHLGRFQPCLKILDHLEETDSGKYSILLQWGINYSSRMFYKTGQ